MTYRSELKTKIKGTAGRIALAAESCERERHVTAVRLENVIALLAQAEDVLVGEFYDLHDAERRT